MSFSSFRETLVPFTRDFESIKTALMQQEYNERSRISKALEGVQSLVMEEWGAGVPCQVKIYFVYSISTDILPFYYPRSSKSFELKHKI